MQNIVEQTDFMVCFALETTHPTTDQLNSGKAQNYRRLFIASEDRLKQLTKGQLSEQALILSDFDQLIQADKTSGIFLPKCLQIDWCICNVKDNFKVVEVATAIVKPDEPINLETASATGLTQEKIEADGDDFKTALEKFRKSVESTVGEGSFKIVSFGDWMIKSQLKLDSIRTTVELGAIFQKAMNILELYYDAPNAVPVADVEGLLKQNELELIPMPQKSKQDCQSLVRVLNRMLRAIKSRQEVEPVAKNDSTNEEKKQPVKLLRERSRDREELPKAGGGRIKVSNVPAQSTSSEILAVFDNISMKITEEKILEDNTKVVTLELENPQDVNLCMGKEGARLGMLQIQIQNDGTDNNPNDGQPQSPGSGGSHQSADFVGMRLRGLPFTCSPQDINSFFANYNVLQGSIKVGKNEDGRMTGQAACLFETKDDAKNALNEMQGQNIGHRWIELYNITHKDWESFGQDQMSSKNINLRNYLNDDNIDRAVKLRGMPFQCSAAEVIDFFKDFNVSNSDVVIEYRNGKMTGFGLVFLESQEEAERAIRELHRQYIGRRYVELSSPATDKY